jgi:hypothetical protein
MKHLTDICNESILSDIDTSIQKTDNIFKQAEAELNTIKNLTWEDILDTAKIENGRLAYKFKFTCPNVIALLGIDHPDADGLIIIFETSPSYGVFTIKHKKQRNYDVSMITTGWVNITNYIEPIRPKKLSVAIKRILEALNKLANIETLKTLCSEFKMK